MPRNSAGWVAPAVSFVALATVITSAVVNAATVASVDHGEHASKTTPELVKEFNAWVNSFLWSESVFEWANETMGAKVAHYFLTYARNFLAGSVLYYLTAGIWHW